MNRLVLTESGGMPIFLKDFQWMIDGDAGVIQTVEGFLKGFGDNYIISGCEVNGTSVSSGYTFLNGRVYKVDAHTKTGNYWSTGLTYDTEGYKQFNNLTYKNTYSKYRATITGSSGVLFDSDNTLANLTSGNSKYSIHFSNPNVSTTFLLGNTYTVYELATISSAVDLKYGDYLIEFNLLQQTTSSSLTDWKWEIHVNDVPIVSKWAINGGLNGSNDYIFNTLLSYDRANLVGKATGLKKTDKISLKFVGTTAGANFTLPTFVYSMKIY